MNHGIWPRSPNFYLHYRRLEPPCPWLARQGPLAYSPAEPPARDYFFQYSWILPGIFDPKVNLREHRYFGSSLKDSASFLFDFWDNARRVVEPGGNDTASLGFSRTAKSGADGRLSPRS